MNVMLSAAKHLAFSATYKDEILRLPPQDDIATQSLTGEEMKSAASPSCPHLRQAQDKLQPVSRTGRVHSCYRILGSRPPEWRSNYVANFSGTTLVLNA
jgi:hypothetical protein